MNVDLLTSVCISLSFITNVLGSTTHIITQYTDSRSITRLDCGQYGRMAAGLETV